MNEAESVRECETQRGGESRVKVVIDGGPGLRPLPYSGQGAWLYRRPPAPLHPFLSSTPASSPTHCGPPLSNGYVSVFFLSELTLINGRYYSVSW